MSEIHIENDGSQLLPDQLRDAEAMYQWAMPDESARASAAVGRLVGARSVELFTEAWSAAAQIPDGALAARALLSERHIWLEN